MFVFYSIKTDWLSAKLLLVLASTVILGYVSHRTLGFTLLPLEAFILPPP
jgi:hypothetical protein